MEALGLFFYALLGAVAGGFLNLCIDRLPQRASIFSPPSHCSACSRSLGLADLVPVASYLLLGGRCRSCGAAIPKRMLVVELLTAAVFGLLWWRLSPGLPLVVLSVYASLLILITFIDLEHRLILNRVIYPALLLALPVALLYRLALGDSVSDAVLSSLLGGVIAFALLFVFYWITNGGIGAGDVKLATFVGLFAGFTNLLPALVIASLCGGLASIVLLVTKVKGRGDAIPYGPFICIGAFVVLFIQ